MEEANGQLIEAVEAGDLEKVQAALAAGADPSLSRKSVSLNVKLRNGITKTDTQLMESALAIAIRDEKVDIVNCLLKAAQQKWDNQRWFEHEALKYASALDFSLAWGGRGFNKRGARVELQNPSDADHVCEDFPLSPNTDIIKALLAHGAQVTESILEAAFELSDRSFLRILEEHVHQWRPQNVLQTGRSPAHQAVAQPPAPVSAASRRSVNVAPSLNSGPDGSVLELSRTLAEQLWINDEQLRIISDQRTQLGEQIKKIDSLQRTVDELQTLLQDRSSTLKSGPRLSSYGQRSLPNGHVGAPDSDTRGRGIPNGTPEKPWAGVPISVGPLPAPTPVNQLMRAACAYAPHDSPMLLHTSYGPMDLFLYLDVIF
ncbi:hypothetical protein HDU93_000327 [Gonapodya sp. JEL0774]|nr:hypothetical protein HDU93_000327 [Gonapodya sp. JEL0774]